MGVAERRVRERAEREARIVAAARGIAEREGWAAVTVRRLADEIEFSQPVLYAHFRNRDAIVAAVALQGFREIADAIAAAAQAKKAGDPLGRAAAAYLDFAAANPALYAAMFVLPTPLRFADAETPPELHAAFDALAGAVRPFCPDGADTATETVWAALHGLAELERAGRIRPSARAERVALVAEAVRRARRS